MKRTEGMQSVPAMYTQCVLAHVCALSVHVCTPVGVYFIHTHNDQHFYLFH